MAQTDPLIGQQIGNYQIMAPIAAGAFGVVYKARHQHIQERVVAIKTLHVYLASQEEHEQFAREAEILEKLRHPHILSLLDFGFYQNRPYLITAYASGGSLRHLLRSTARKPLPWDLAFHLLQQSGQGLHYAHQQRVIHRDLKPENILLSDQQDVLIADFGISSMLTSTSSVAYSREIGTPSYMAPEQFRGEMSAESDQYALACMAYEMVTGRRPFEATNDAVGFMHINMPPPPLRQFNPQVFPHVEQAILQALAKERRERFPDIAAFIDALRTGTTPLSASSVATELAAYRPAQPVSTEKKGKEEVSSYTLKHLLDMGHGLYKQENYEQALTAYERALQSYPQSIEALKGKGDVLRKLKRHMDALAVYDQALGIDPNSIVVLMSKGQLFGEIEMYQEALATFDQATSRRPADPATPLVFCAKADVLLKSGKTVDALDAYSQALQRDPKCAEAKDGGQNILLGWKNLPPQQALVSLDEALSRRPGDRIIRAYKGDALIRLGNYDEALALYDQAQERDPDGDWINKMPEVLKRYREQVNDHNRAIERYKRTSRYDEVVEISNRSPEKERRRRLANRISMIVVGGAMLLSIALLVIPTPLPIDRGFLVTVILVGTIGFIAGLVNFLINRSSL